MLVTDGMLATVHLLRVLHGMLETAVPLILKTAIDGMLEIVGRGIQSSVEGLTPIVALDGLSLGQIDLLVAPGAVKIVTLLTFGFLLTVEHFPLPIVEFGTLKPVALLTLGFVELGLALPRMPQTAPPGPAYLGS